MTFWFVAGLLYGLSWLMDTGDRGAFWSPDDVTAVMFTFVFLSKSLVSAFVSHT